MIKLPSNFAIGDRIAVRFDGGENDGTTIFGYVRAVIFSSSKVRYSIMVITGRPEGSLTPEQMKARLQNEEEPPTGECYFTLHNVDSALVHPAKGEPLEMPADIYS
jgi:hypothetical protein